MLLSRRLWYQSCQVANNISGSPTHFQWDSQKYNSEIWQVCSTFRKCYAEWQVILNLTHAISWMCIYLYFETYVFLSPLISCMGSNKHSFRLNWPRPALCVTHCLAAFPRDRYLLKLSRTFEVQFSHMRIRLNLAWMWYCYSNFLAL